MRDNDTLGWVLVVYMLLILIGAILFCYWNMTYWPVYWGMK